VAEWKVIEQTLMRRGDEGKKSGVYLNDVRIPDEKLRKDIARHVPLSSKFTSNIPGESVSSIYDPSVSLLHRSRPTDL
jgi:hypothetical protein